jgi:hypothetical protein
MSQEEATRRIEEFLEARPTLSVVPSNTPNERTQVLRAALTLLDEARCAGSIVELPDP